MNENEYIDMPADDSISDNTDNYDPVESTDTDVDGFDSEDIATDSESGAGSDDSDVTERLDTLIETITSSNKQQYFNDDLGFYVFPDLDTLLLYYPPEDNDLTEWIQTTDGNWVRLENLETYESYIFEQSENMEQSEVEETMNAETMENMSGNLEMLASTVSENSIAVTMDSGTTEMLQAVLVSQNDIHTELILIGGLVSVLFLVVVVDYIQRCAKRIIKNFMKGGGDNND